MRSLPLLALAATLLLSTAAHAEPPAEAAATVEVVKKIKGKKLEKLLIGNWSVYPGTEPERGMFLSAMAASDVPIAEFAKRYRFDAATVAELEDKRAQAGDAPPPPMLVERVTKGISVEMRPDGTMLGMAGDDSKEGTWVATGHEDNRLSITLDGDEKFTFVFIDQDRIAMTKAGDPRTIIMARMQ
tara:strand:+ start:438 stop:995 length:558 start_codon:yes stop_codon:yes gene_type:complete